MADDTQEPRPPGPSFDLSAEKVLLGRRRECDIVIPDSKCSKYHARIFREDKAFRIVDLGSQNGTFVNGEKVASRLLDQGDRVRLGFTVFTFTIDEGAEPPRARLAFLERIEAPLEGEALAEPSIDAPAAAGDAQVEGARMGEGEREGGPALPVDAEPDDDTKVLDKSPLAKPHESEFAPFSGEGKRPTEVFFVPVLVTALLGALAVFLFSPEIREFTGLDPREEAAVSPPEPTQAEIELRETLDEVLLRLEGLEKRLDSATARKEPGVRAEDVSALRGVIEERFGSLEKGGRSIEVDLSELRETLLKRLKILEEGLAGSAEKPSPGAEPAEEAPLSPEEALLRKVMEALEKGE